MEMVSRPHVMVVSHTMDLFGPPSSLLIVIVLPLSGALSAVETEKAHGIQPLAAIHNSVCPCVFTTKKEKKRGQLCLITI